MFELFDLRNKKAIVTGASGGIGHALAVGLAQHGADVAVTSRTLSKLEPVAKEIQALGRKSLAISADVTSEESIIQMVEKVYKEFSRIDILVNAAGTTTRFNAEDYSIAEWRKVIDFNAQGCFICCKNVGKKMIAQKGGKIVNVSSVRGRYGAPAGGAAYSPSKAAVDGLTRSLAAEWAKYNILVNAIAPSIVRTELTKGFFENKQLATTQLARVPLNRWAEPEDLVGATIFLASAASDYVTGTILFIDGGMFCY
jgi:NAD(P)-dependent dehydrogenase (short-subunit alcohol dehydrogenase family)